MLPLFSPDDFHMDILDFYLGQGYQSFILYALAFVWCLKRALQLQGYKICLPIFFFFDRLISIFNPLVIYFSMREIVENLTSFSPNGDQSSQSRFLANLYFPEWPSWPPFSSMKFPLDLGILSGLCSSPWSVCLFLRWNGLYCDYYRCNKLFSFW